MPAIGVAGRRDCVPLWKNRIAFSSLYCSEKGNVAIAKFSMLLLAEVGFFDAGVGGQLLRGAFHDDRAGFEHVAAVGMLQGGIGVLLDEQNRYPFLVDLVN